MTHARFRLASVSIAALLLAAAPLAGRLEGLRYAGVRGDQDAAALQSTDPPANGVWLDSLDLAGAQIRRGRGQRGSTTPPPPLVYRLGGVTYPHALPLVSDGDLTIDLDGAASKFVAMIGVDDG